MGGVLRTRASDKLVAIVEGIAVEHYGGNVSLAVRVLIQSGVGVFGSLASVTSEEWTDPFRVHDALPAVSEGLLKPDLSTPGNPVLRELRELREPVSEIDVVVRPQAALPSQAEARAAKLERMQR